MADYNIVSLNSGNLMNEHICCALAKDKKNTEGVMLKKNWLRDRFEDGLIFKKFDVQGKAFIEYIPAENSWRPVIAPGYIMIHCLWVSGSFKGKGSGTKLLEECLNDAKGKNGVAIVTSNKPYMPEKKLFLKNGFEVSDTAFHFELLVKRFNDAPMPTFTEKAKKGIIEHDKGLVIEHSDQCPFVSYYIKEMEQVACQHGLPAEIIKVTNKEKAQNSASPYGTFGVFYNGKFLSHEIMSQSKFEKLLKEVLG